MQYYIEKPNTWRAANRKCAELQDYVRQLTNCLIFDELSRDALIEQLRDKVKELNEAYPRSKRLKVSFDFQDFISCYPEDHPVDEYVFTIRIHPILKIYRFAEKTDVLKEGGQQ